MKLEPDKFLYVFLEDMEDTPKLVFEIHEKSFPKESMPYGTRDLDNLEKEDVLADVDAVDKIGFFAKIVVLTQNRINKGHHDAAVLYIAIDGNRFSIDLNIHENAPLKGRGAYYGFVPLKPFYPECDMDDNVLDWTLNMRVGRTIIQALLD